MENNLFYRVYDQLFSDKDYAHEVEMVLSIARRYLRRPITHMLEIGCGTGNHTLELAKVGIPLTAIDIDPQMIAICKQKVKNQKFTHVEVIHGEIETLNMGTYDLVVSLFNVVTYIDAFDKLLSFFRGVYSALEDCGVFLFDAWNGVAAMRNPPNVKHLRVESDGKIISAELKPDTDFFQQRTYLTYFLNVQNTQTNKVEQDRYTFSQSLWTPNQLMDGLQMAGFRQYISSALFKPDTPANEHHWKIMFTCLK